MVSRMVGETGSVVALEPGAHNFETAGHNKETHGAHNLTLLCAAASNQSGEISFSDGMNGRIGLGVVRPSYSVDDLARGSEGRMWSRSTSKVTKERFSKGLLQHSPLNQTGMLKYISGLGLEANGSSPEEIVGGFQERWISPLYSG